METDTTTESTNEVFELNLCDMGSTIPVSHLSLEDGIDVPLPGWQQVFDQLGTKVLTDPAGRPAINTLAARKLFQHLRHRDELAAENRDRLSAKVVARHPVPVMAGFPMVEGATPYESMVAADKIVTPAQEFGGGRQKPRFLQDELEATRRSDEEKKAQAAARTKERLADQMNDHLGGKKR